MQSSLSNKWHFNSLKKRNIQKKSQNARFQIAMSQIGLELKKGRLLVLPLNEWADVCRFYY